MLDYEKQKQIIKWLLAFLLVAGFFALATATCNAQTRTTNFSVPLFNAGQVPTAGSKTDTSTANVGINSVMLRFDKYLALMARKDLSATITGRWSFSDLAIFNDSSEFNHIAIFNDLLFVPYGYAELGANGQTGQLKIWAYNGVGGYNYGTIDVASISANRSWLLPNVSGIFAFIDAGQTFTSATWNGTAISTTYGGTGQNWSAITAGRLPYFSGTGTMSTLAIGSNGAHLTLSSGVPAWTTATYPSTISDNQVMLGTGTNAIGVTSAASAYQVLRADASGDPNFGQVALNQSAAVTGTLPVGNGGTGLTSAGSDDNFIRSTGGGLVSEAVPQRDYKAGSFQNLAGITTAPDSFIVFIPTITGYTVDSIFAIRVGGTAASINVSKNGSTLLLASNYTTTTSVASAGAVQNGTLTSNDILRIRLVSVSGSPTEIYVTLKLSRNL